MPKKDKRIGLDPDDELKAKIVKEAAALERSWAGQCQRNLKVYYAVKAIFGNVEEEVPVVAIIQRLVKLSQEQASGLDFMTPTRLREEKGNEEPIVFRTPEVPVVVQQPRSQMSSDQQKK